MSANRIIDTMEYINGEQMPVSGFAHALDEPESAHFAYAGRHIKFFTWRGLRIPLSITALIQYIEQVNLITWWLFKSAGRVANSAEPDQNVSSPVA